jgi:hypothetical protein
MDLSTFKMYEPIVDLNVIANLKTTYKQKSEYNKTVLESAKHLFVGTTLGSFKEPLLYVETDDGSIYYLDMF